MITPARPPRPDHAVPTTQVRSGQRPAPLVLTTAQQQDPAFVYFYYSGTVRVEEESDDRLLTSLRWFLDGVPDVQRQWREGTLITPGKPERD